MIAKYNHDYPFAKEVEALRVIKRDIERQVLAGSLETRALWAPTREIINVQRQIENKKLPTPINNMLTALDEIEASFTPESYHNAVRKLQIAAEQGVNSMHWNSSFFHTNADNITKVCQDMNTHATKLLQHQASAVNGANSHAAI